MKTIRETDALAPSRQGDVVARFVEYEHAASAVDYLDDRGFPVEELSIVGRDLRLQDDMPSNSLASWEVLKTAALAGAGTGGLFALIFEGAGWISLLVGDVVLALAGSAYGAGVGVATALLATPVRSRAAQMQRTLRAQVHDLVLAPNGDFPHATSLVEQYRRERTGP